MIDVHCHVKDSGIGLAQFLESKHISKICVMGTNYADWETIAIMARNHPERIIPAFGIHPWFVEEINETTESSSSPSEKPECLDRYDNNRRIPKNWSVKLEEYLDEFPGSIVGECGLDKVAKNYATGKTFPWELQVSVLKTQLQIAAKKRRPVSLHCVKAQTDLYRLITSLEPNMLPEKIMLHSYSGSKESLNMFFRLSTEISKRFYVSFSQFVNFRSPKFVDVCRAVPLDKILIESDFDDFSRIEEVMVNVCNWVSECRGLSPEETAKVTVENSLEFYSSIK